MLGSVGIVPGALVAANELNESIEKPYLMVPHLQLWFAHGIRDPWLRVADGNQTFHHLYQVQYQVAQCEKLAGVQLEMPRPVEELEWSLDIVIINTDNSL
jgi:hypothetical protein